MTFKEGLFLPITREATELALADIASNPSQRLFEEGAILQQFQQELNFLIAVRIDKQSFDPTFIEGALWTYKILRTQAELNKTKMPEVTEVIRLNYFSSRIEELRSTYKGEGKDENFARLAARMTAEEPELARALKEITKYRPYTNAFYGGAAETYLILKTVQEAQELERKFS